MFGKKVLTVSFKVNNNWLKFFQSIVRLTQKQQMQL